MNVLFTGSWGAGGLARPRILCLSVNFALLIYTRPGCVQSKVFHRHRWGWTFVSNSKTNQDIALKLGKRID